MKILIRVIALLMLVLGALSLVRKVLAAFTPAREQVRTGAAGHLVKDPVCGTFIPQASALQGGKEFFCSEECRQRFLA